MREATLWDRTDPHHLVPAPAELRDLLRSYPQTRARGPLLGGRRLTLLATKRAVAIDEGVDILHVVEVESEGVELYIMGPKEVVGMYVDGHLVGEPAPPGYRFVSDEYNGRVLSSPGVDTNWEISRYKLQQVGRHRVQWRAGGFASNVLCIDVRATASN
jgi:hypothetical protein